MFTAGPIEEGYYSNILLKMTPTGCYWLIPSGSQHVSNRFHKTVGFFWAFRDFCSFIQLFSCCVCFFDILKVMFLLCLDFWWGKKVQVICLIAIFPFCFFPFFHLLCIKRARYSEVNQSVERSSSLISHLALSCHFFSLLSLRSRPFNTWALSAHEHS